jgi:hypothetical protein
MDSGRFRKVVVAASVALTAVLGTVSGLVGPHYDASDNRMLGAIARDQPGWNASALLGLAGSLAAMITVLGLIHILRFRVPLLRGVGGSLSLLGVLALPGLIAADLVKGQMANQPDRAAMVGLAGHYTSPSGIHWFYRMLIAYSLGLILLAVGLYRARLAKRWIAATFGLGASAAFAFDALPGGHGGFGVASLIAGAIFVTGSSALAWTVLTTPDLEWQAPPVGGIAFRDVGLER